MAKIVIVMPAYRAEGTLAKTVADIPPNLEAELILVDDASPDNTAKLARNLGLHVVVHPENRGYGGNQKTCYTEALDRKADIVVMLHPDYQYDPKAVPLLVAPILAGDADMTFGSRFAGLGDPISGGMPMYRYVGNRLTTRIENLLLGARFTETHSGLRAYTRASLLALPFLHYSDDFAFDSQLLVDAITTRQRVVEVPIPTRYTKESSSISILPSIKYIIDSIVYCAGRVSARGRRGRRWPFNRQLGPPRRVPRGLRTEEACAACGSIGLIRIARHDLRKKSRFEGQAGNHDLRSSDALLFCSICGMTSESLENAANTWGRPSDNKPSRSEDEANRRTLLSALDVASGYVVTGRRLLEIGAWAGLAEEIVQARGWIANSYEWSRLEALIRGSSPDEADLEVSATKDRKANVVALWRLDEATEPVEVLEFARRAIDRDGLLVLTVGANSRESDSQEQPTSTGPSLHNFTPAALKAILSKTGFRGVEWRPSSSENARGPLHVFRSRSSREPSTLALVVARAC